MTFDKLILDKADPTTLTLSNSELTDADSPALIEYLQTNTSCTKLDLSTNHLTANAATWIAQALTQSTTLRELNLRSNQLTDLGIAAIVAALSSKSATLQILHLGNNVITDSGAKQLATMLEVNRSLTDLWLEENCIGDGGVEHLSRSLTKANHSLQNLYLHHNPPITDLSVDTLLAMLHHNRHVHVIDLEGCSISKLGQTRMVALGESRVRVDLNAQMEPVVENKTISRASFHTIDEIETKQKRVTPITNNTPATSRSSNGSQSGVCVIL